MNPFAADSDFRNAILRPHEKEKDKEKDEKEMEKMNAASKARPLSDVKQSNKGKKNADEVPPRFLCNLPNLI